MALIEISGKFHIARNTYDMREMIRDHAIKFRCNLPLYIHFCEQDTIRAENDFFDGAAEKETISHCGGG